MLANQIGLLRLEPCADHRPWQQTVVRHMADGLQMLGSLALSPLAFSGDCSDSPALDVFAAGTLGHVWPRHTALQSAGMSADCRDGVVLHFPADAQAGVGRAVVDAGDPAGHRPHTDSRGLAAGCVCAGHSKTGSGTKRRLASAVRGGLLETLALARWRVEAYALVPATVAQIVRHAAGDRHRLSRGPRSGGVHLRG